MEITGIIAEYNPFHLGHAYQLEEIRKRHPGTGIIALLSGSFTQRGEPALLDKWDRARLAVQGGCDLVLELPFAFACRSAQHFARGGVLLLSRLGAARTLAFGAETGELELLKRTAEKIGTSSFQQLLHQQITEGLAYASALESALAQDGDSSFIKKPNNILALEYLRALRDFPSLSPLLVERRGAGYHSRELHSPLPSASALRSALYEGKLTQAEAELAAPPATACKLASLTQGQLPRMDRLYPALQLALLRQSSEKLRHIYGMEEGLENRLQQAASAPCYKEFIRRAVSRRYPATRLQRLCLHLLLGLDREAAASFDRAGPLYARLLSAGPQGRELLKIIKRQSSLPLIAKTTQFLSSRLRKKKLQELSPLQQMLAFDTWATELRELTLPSPGNANDFSHPPIFIHTR